MERLTFETGEFYHVYNRSIEKRILFPRESDYVRFTQAAYYFNDATFQPENFKYKGLTLVKDEKRKELVEILAFCWMPTHYHFLLRQKVDGGITTFMRRLGTGFTMYFNKKYDRNGNIFEGPFKARHIAKDDYLLHATRYIHLNPLELYDRTWKEKGTKNMEASKKFVLQYRWSSLHNYLGGKIFSEIISTPEFWRIFGGGQKEYKQFLWEWLHTGVLAPFDAIKV